MEYHNIHASTCKGCNIHNRRQLKTLSLELAGRGALWLLIYALNSGYIRNKTEIKLKQNNFV